MSRGVGGGGKLPPPKGFYLGFQFSLFKDRQGLKCTLKARVFRLYFEKVLFLKKNPKWGVVNPDMTPKMERVEMMTETPVGEFLEPEDI